MKLDIVALGWDTAFTEAYRPFDRQDHRPARVARVDRAVYSLLTAEGPARAGLGGALLAQVARDPLTAPCTGDWVALRSWPDQRTTIEAVLPRRTRIVRAAAGGQSHGQVLAANVDYAAVVEAMDPGPNPGRIERLLALAWASGAQPLVILTKADLVRRPEQVVDQFADLAPGAEMIAVSAREGTGLDRLRPLVAPGRTLALLGPSGAGKSTLVNALAGTTMMVTQAIRRADGRGRHTTTQRALIPLPGGGAVLDTPGLRGVGLHAADGSTDAGAAADGLDQAFADIDALAAACRFDDCRHESEPGCAVRGALANGDLSARRLESWRRLRRELTWQGRRGTQIRRRYEHRRAAGRPPRSEG
ncbi:MAG: ribosome small subunit-dependent GTPase A [Actinobacteria bacterium 13_2_20CM_2_72_6]|nr:MAG: ribosome small subunit-dependent GTPase A [Actinobacteria bacterium 13_2_20CM_2_72_6]